MAVQRRSFPSLADISQNLQRLCLQKFCCLYGQISMYLWFLFLSFSLQSQFYEFHLKKHGIHCCFHFDHLLIYVIVSCASASLCFGMAIAEHATISSIAPTFNHVILRHVANRCKATRCWGSILFSTLTFSFHLQVYQQQKQQKAQRELPFFSSV